MNNRLLSEEEAWQATTGKQIASAQLAKTDKEWVEWVVIESSVIRLGDEQGELANGDYIAIPAERWRERRKEIGL
jgi:hypothetical protein